MIDLRGVGAHQHAGHAGQRESRRPAVSETNFAVVSGAPTTHQRRWSTAPAICRAANPDSCAAVADRDFAGDEARQFERGAGLDVAAVELRCSRSGRRTSHVAGVALDLSERFQARG